MATKVAPELKGSKIKTRSARDRQEADRLYFEALALAKQSREKSAARVVPLLRAATSLGHRMAAHALASWYLHGIGVRKNFRKAVELERVAADGGITEAVYNLAVACESGRGTKKDEVEAFRLYRVAARRGDVDAMYGVGRCLFYGIGTRRNPRLGEKWIERSRSANNQQKRA